MRAQRRAGRARTRSFPALKLVHVRNSGVAFGAFADGGVVVIVVVVRRARRAAGLLRDAPATSALRLAARPGCCSAARSATSSTASRDGAVTDFIKLPALAGVQRRRHRDHLRGARAAVVRGALRRWSCAIAPERRRASASTSLLAEPLGSRSRAARLIDAGRGARRRRRAAPSATRCAAGERRRRRRRRRGGRARPTSARRSTSPSPTRTSTCSSSTSPPGVVVHPARGHRDRHAGPGAGRARPPGGDDGWRAGIVHRLDRDTSGLLVVAKTDAVARRAQGRAAARARSRASTWRWSRAARPRAPARSTRRSAATAASARGMSTDTDDAARGAHALRARRGAARAHAAARAPRDRPHPPDPRAPAGDRPPGRRRSRVRHTPGCSASSASSCTPRAWRSRTRSPATRSTSRARCRPTSPRRSERPRRTALEAERGTSEPPRPELYGPDHRR